MKLRGQSAATWYRRAVDTQNPDHTHAVQHGHQRTSEGMPVTWPTLRAIIMGKCAVQMVHYEEGGTGYITGERTSLLLIASPITRDHGEA